MSDYKVACECGARIPVSAVQAGSSVACSCGRDVNVPTLSSLRKSAGQPPIPVDNIATITAMIKNGELPDNDLCPYSNRPANETVFFRMQCERTWARQNRDSDAYKAFFYVLVFGWLGAMLTAGKSRNGENRENETLGRDTWVDVPVRISSDVRPNIIRMRRQKKLKELLSQTPIYAELLEEFPQTRVSVLKDQ